MKRTYSLLFKVYFLLCVNLLFSQQYEIGCFTKINHLTGNLNQNLRAGDQFGYEVDGLGDLNGDGINDIVVGAFTDDDGGPDRGAVYILFLNEDDTVKHSQKISSTRGGFTGVLSNYDVFGASVAYLGDLNGDGKPEIAVGAEYDGDGGYWHGAIWIISLNTDGTVAAQSKISSTQGGFTGSLNGDVVFGTDVENIGDLDGDGVEDIVVGSRRDSDGGEGTGAIWILYLNNDFTVKSHSKISATRGNFSGNLSPGDYFGGSVASLGDIDGDGVVDLVVGAYRDDDGGTDFGAFYVLFLNSNGSVKRSNRISALEGNGDFQLNLNAIFGKSIDTLADIDGDGLVEILVGCARCNNPVTGRQSGAYYIVELNNDGTVNDSYQYTEGVGGFDGNLNSGDSFGISVAFITHSSPLKVVAGASKDGPGAVYIMNYSENLSDVAITANTPGSCGSGDVEITFSNLSPNTEYIIDYKIDETSASTGYLTSNGNGEITLSGLEGEKFSGFTIIKGPCSFEFSEEFEFTNPDPPNVDFQSVDTSGCNTDDGQIVLSGLESNLEYSLQFTVNGSVQDLGVLQSNENGEISLNSLSPGLYSDFILDVNDCSFNFDEELEIRSSGTINPDIAFSDPSSCSSNDGVITITNLEPFANYSIMFEFNSQLMIFEDRISNAAGEVQFDNLEAGRYSQFELLYNDCSVFLPVDLNLEASNEITLENLSAADCGLENGALLLGNLEANQEYILNYVIDGATEERSFRSTGEGEVLISNLRSGNYSNVYVSGVDGSCSYSLNNFEIECLPQEQELCYTYVPFLTPNGDGRNDQWNIQIESSQCSADFKCYIFDRYGKLLKVLNGPNEYWDGNFNGRPLPSDDYWIRIENAENLQAVEKTNISLIR